MNTSQHTVI